MRILPAARVAPRLKTVKALQLMNRKRSKGAFRPTLLPMAMTCAALLLAASDGFAQIQRSPAGVNVNTQGPTTVFISYGGLQNQIAAEAVWCADIIPATPDIGFKCDPAKTWGRLPARYELARPSGNAGFTDIMTIPQNVARRAYESAAAGANSAFYYVRRFVSTTGGPDEYVFVLCRLAGGGASVPLALTDVKLQFAKTTEVLSVRAGETPPAFSAEITHTGTGRLAGRWEIVVPGDEPPTAQNLLPEASLPVEQRSQQKRFAQIGRFDVFVPPGGTFRLKGPAPEKLPTAIEGLYQILMRVEATSDVEGNTDLSGLGSGTGVVFTGGVAGFSLPALRYYVGAPNPALETGVPQLIEQLQPDDDARLKKTAPLEFRWATVAEGVLLRLEIRDLSNVIVLSAIIESPASSYVAPTWLPERVSGSELTWRVVSIDGEGQPLQSSSWRKLHLID